MSDIKDAGKKPDITHVRTPLKVYTARGCEYGDHVYQRANYLRSPRTGNKVKDHWLRYREYLRAAAAHISKTLDAMEHHQAEDPELKDEDGLMNSAYAADTSLPSKPGGLPSNLPHVAHACASLNILVTQAVWNGLLPEDPGRPWLDEPKTKCESPALDDNWFDNYEKDPRCNYCDENGETSYELEGITHRVLCECVEEKK